MSTERIVEFSILRCPNCRSMLTHWRHGLHFDHMRRCSDCERSYDPADEYANYLTQEADRLEFNTYKE